MQPPRPGLVAMGTDIDPVPFTGLAANFSPIPRTAPPPLGSCMAGGREEGDDSIRGKIHVTRREEEWARLLEERDVKLEARRVRPGRFGWDCDW